MELNCVIIDDEPLARECIENYIREIDFLCLVGSGNNPLELSKIQEKHTVDLLFLDIQMPLMNGIAFLKTIKNPPLVILTTAFPNYALEGFELDVMDYLLKPITFNRFFKGVSKVKSYVEMAYAKQEVIEAPTEDAMHIFIKCDTAFVKIRLSDILFIEAMQNYVIFHTVDKKKHMTLMTLKKVVENLGGSGFLQIHKSYVVSIPKIETMNNGKIGIGAFQIPVSRKYKDLVAAKVLKNRVWRK